MSFNNIKDIEQRADYEALDGLNQSKYDEINAYVIDKACMYTVHESRDYCKTLLDTKFTFGTDFTLMEDGPCTRIIINPNLKDGMYQLFFDNGNIFYSSHRDYHVIKAKL